jgi:acetyltransferase-like isoleucine patch superfamily enzyme
MKNPFDRGYYESAELRDIGFKSVGDSVKIAKNCTIIAPENIVLGNNVRIDAYCSIIATGSIIFGNHIHIGAYCHLLGRGGLTFGDISGTSQGAKIYTASDDYSGRSMAGPMVPEELVGTEVKAVEIGRHTIIGAGAVILPGCHIGRGAAVGALSLVTKPVAEWTIVSGVPARRVGTRRNDLLEAEQQWLAREAGLAD